MFVCYIPDESADLCYAVGVLSCLAKIPGPSRKSEAKKDSAEHEERAFAWFQLVCKFQNNVHTTSGSA